MEVIARLEYRNASLSVEMFERHWELGIDAGDTVEDLLKWSGTDLEVLLEDAATYLAIRPVAAMDSGVVSGSIDDLPEFLKVLSSLRASPFELPVDVAYVPHSQVSPEAPWEVVLSTDGEMVVSGGLTALEALAGAVEFRHT
ncbi:hypothetical protein [Pengzhenrongella sicca]|uniref:Uncharacterized protein n=1 Tax=Pengzhenrongella sicca TaxID=2819238 RepID=A0A8A4ZHK5_9MICO|nr:hypothetical protein [Pengzhenrongella sicca]QTE30871.1 hypothetical protein J4E96_08065 [Pengzhenrongella sicca]